MDLNSLGNFVDKNGALVTITFLLMIFCYKVWMQMSKKLDEVTALATKLTKNNEKLTIITDDLIEKLNIKIDKLSDKIDKLYEKVNKIDEK